MIDGTTPLFYIGAPTAGTGKSLLAECCTIIATGGRVAPCAFGNDDEELRKHLTARLLEGPQVVVFDNLPTKKVVDRPSLAAVLTTTIWSDRVLDILKRLPCRPPACGLHRQQHFMVEN